MKTKIFLYTLACAVAVGVSHPAYAAEHHHLTDTLFAKKAAAGGLTEVELGKIAQQNGESQDVKDFGAKMVTDHTTINDNLKGIATKDNLTIPDKPNDEQQELIGKLRKETGKEFDTAYINAMVKAHVADSDLFEQEAANAKNPDLKQFASDSLQVIKQHLAMIEGIADSHGIATAHHGSNSSTSMSETSNGAEMTPPPSAAGDAGMSKSGAAPGANANPPGVNTPNTDQGGAPGTPATPDAAESKSGAGPGANGNPVPQSQQ